MPIRTSDVVDQDFFDAYELASDGYHIYLNDTLVSTTFATKIVVINLPFDGTGIFYSRDHHAESGDLVHLLGTSGGAADGYYTIDTVIDETSFTVRETIASSTGGFISFMYPPGASRIGFDLTGAVHIIHNDVQGALHDLDTSITGAGSATVTQVEIDFGSIPTRTKTFTIVDSNVFSNSKLVITQSGTAATGRQFDENEMDPIIFSGVPSSGQFTLIANSLTGPVVGKYKVNYMIG